MKKEILTFGPLCVLPEWQGCGIGGVLLEKTLELAKQQGFEGVVIFGEPDYYPLYGFKTCENFGITTKVFEELSEEENEEFTKNFSTPVKQKFPCQWDEANPCQIYIMSVE